MNSEYQDWTKTEDRAITWALNHILAANEAVGYHTDDFEVAYIDCFLCNLMYNKGKTIVKAFARDYYAHPTGMSAFKNS